jgi:hypothetical protein
LIGKELDRQGFKLIKRCYIIVYFLNKNLRNCNILIGLLRVKGYYNKENITKAIIPIIKNIINLAKIKYYYIDNVTVNDVIIQIIYNRFKPNILKPYKRRVKYLNYIINLTAIAFLFNCD